MRNVHLLGAHREACLCNWGGAGGGRCKEQSTRKTPVSTRDVFTLARKLDQTCTPFRGPYRDHSLSLSADGETQARKGGGSLDGNPPSSFL